jgi:DnaJ-domain-containing protein 1
MKNKASDFYSLLFAEMERLSDETLKGDTLKEEITRAEALSKIANSTVAHEMAVLKAISMGMEAPGFENTGEALKILTE